VSHPHVILELTLENDLLVQSYNCLFELMRFVAIDAITQLQTNEYHIASQMHVDDLWVTFLPICGDSVVMWYPVHTGTSVSSPQTCCPQHTTTELKAHTQIMKII